MEQRLARACRLLRMASMNKEESIALKRREGAVLHRFLKKAGKNPAHETVAP